MRSFATHRKTHRHYFGRRRAARGATKYLVAPRAARGTLKNAEFGLVPVRRIGTRGVAGKWAYSGKTASFWEHLNAEYLTAVEMSH